MSLDEIRGQIDQLDDEVIKLLAQRQQLVERAAAHKQDEAAVRAPGRRERMMERRRTRSVEEGVHPEVVARVYTAMIDAFIDVELTVHHARDGAPVREHRDE
ncbi:chorismate mutase [Parasphingorhabdus pacifica]